MSSIIRGNDLFDSANYKEYISVPTAYHIYNGEVSATNTVVTNGFSTTLYTGNGATQAVATGVDMATQHGNDASETYGGLVWVKNRSSTNWNFFNDTVRGVTKYISSNSTQAETIDALGFTAFNNNGFTGGTNTAINGSGLTYVSWNFQTTHRVTGTTNHGKAYTCHYNPFTGFTMVKYEGSGISGHEIPHHLGRKLGFVTTKNLSSVLDWFSYIDVGFLLLNATSALNTSIYAELKDSNTTLSATAGANVSSNQYIMYGWANSYYDEKNTLIGNYEIGVYQGTGVAGNKVTTKGKPAWVMIKGLNDVSAWVITDNLRNTAYLQANATAAETDDTNDIIITNTGFTVNSTASSWNTSGSQYLYMVVYDNDSGSGKSKYPKATDTTNLNINALVPYANGIDAKGSKVSISYKNETITLSNALVQGKNYPYSKSDGTYWSSAIDIKRGTNFSTAATGSVLRGHEFDLNTNLCTKVTSIFNDTVFNKFGDASAKFWYKLNGNVNDESGVYSGTANSILYAPSFDGQCASFDGSSSYISTTTVPDIDSSTAGTYAVSLWSKLDSTDGVVRCMMDIRQKLNILVDNVAGYILFVNVPTSGGAGYNTFVPYTKTSKWVNITIVKRSGSNYLDVYFDGKTVQGTYNSSSGTYTYNSLFNIGRETAARYYFKGQLDNIRLFNKALSEAEIISLFNIYNYTYTNEQATYLDCIVYADQNGQVEYVEQLPKTVYVDEIKANEFKGKNACTAWVNFDGTTTPPTIRDSYNVAGIIRTATGAYTVYFKDIMDLLTYTPLITAESGSQGAKVVANQVKNLYSVSFDVGAYTSAGSYSLVNGLNINVQITGGRN